MSWEGIPGVESASLPLGGGAFHRPQTLKEALFLLAEGVAAGNRPHLLAGGTDWVVDRHLHPPSAEDPTPVVDLTGIAALRPITRTGDSLVIGALSTYSQLRHDSTIQQQFKMLVAMAREVGAIGIQNLGTLGGNIATASPAGDSLPVLLAAEAFIGLASVRGVREVPAADFFLTYRKTALLADELITSVRLPLPAKGAVQHFRKVGTRRAQAISKVALAGMAGWEESRLVGVRLAMASVAPIPVRLREVEAVLEGRKSAELMQEASLRREVAAALGKDIHPIDDVRSTGSYRQAVAVNLVLGAVREFLEG